MSNYWSTNFISQQGGDFSFRYVITSAPKLDAAALTRLGWESMTPLESDIVPASMTPHGPSEASLLTLDNENVAITAWKRAEDGKGTILRLLELAGRDENVRVHTHRFQVTAAEQCSLLEECTEKMPVTEDGVSISLRPYQIVTVRLQTGPVGEQ
jgi:alpha-mannosidase